MSTYAQELEHIVSMAMRRGWWQHSRLRARQLESDDSGAFKGLLQDVRQRLTEAGFRPSPDELAEW